MDQTSTQSIFEQMEIEKPSLFYATIGERFASYIIDTFASVGIYMLTIIVIAVVMAANGSTQYEIREWEQNRLYTIPLSYFITVLYFFLLEGFSKGRTLGKLFMGTRAVKEDSSPINWKDAFIRTVSRCVPFEPLCIFSDRIWHDKWSKTMVVNNRQRLSN
jgi:uncharacterized RDD family membrane protein YckC